MSAGMNAVTGKRLTGRDHLRQSIADLLSTPIGTRVGRRDYGSLLPELVDHPLEGKTLLRAYAATAEAIMREIPEAVLQQVAFTTGTDGQLVLDIDMADAGGANDPMSVPLGLRGVVT